VSRRSARHPAPALHPDCASRLPYMSTSLNVNVSPDTLTDRERSVLAKQVEELGEWFHNIDLLGVRTAPHHFLGDFPNIKCRHIAAARTSDHSLATVL